MALNLPKIVQRIEVIVDNASQRLFNKQLDETESKLRDTDKATADLESSTTKLGKAHDSSGKSVLEAGERQRKLRVALTETRKENDANAFSIAEVARKHKIATDAVTEAQRKQKRETTGLSSAIRGIRADMKTAGQATALFATIIGAIKLPGLVAGAKLALQALNALSAGAIGLVGTLGPLLNLVAALPAALTLAAGGLGAVLIGTRGVTDAIGASLKAKSPTGGAGGEDAVTKARRVEDATRAVARANETLSDSQREVERAQEDLNKAWLDATEALRDLREEQTRGQISVARAEIALARAQQRNTEAQADSAATDLDKREALLDVKDAELDLLDAQEKRTSNARDLNEAEKKGVAGSDAVSDATERLSDAQQSVVDNQVELTRAIEDLARGQKQSAGAADAAAAAMAKLSPEAQKFVKQITGNEALFKRIKFQVQDALFGPLNEGFKVMLRNAQPFATFLTESAAGIGDLGKQVATFLGSAQVGSDLEELAGRNRTAFESLGKGVTAALQIVLDLATTGAPVIQKFIDLAVGGLERLASHVRDLRASGELGEMFERGLDRAKQFGRIIRDTFAGIRNIFRAATGLSDDLTVSMEEGAARFREITGSVTGQNKLKQFFDDARAPLHEMNLLLHDVFGLLVRQSSNSDGGLAHVIEEIRTKGLPIIETILNAVGPEFVDVVLQLAEAFGNLFASIFGQTGPMLYFIKSLASLFQTIADILNKVPGLKDLVVVLLTVGTAVRSIALIGKASGLTALISNLGKLTGITKGLKTGMEAFKATITGGGGLINALKAFGIALNEAILANPIGLIVVAVAALVAGVIYAYFHFKRFREIVDGVIDHIQKITADFVTGIKVLWERFGDDILRVAGGIWKQIKGTFEVGINLVLAVVQPLIDILHGDWAKAWEDFKDRIGGVWKGIKDVIGGFIDQIRGLIGGLVDGLKDVPRQILEALDGMWDFVWEQATAAFNTVKDIITEGPGNLVEFIGKLPGKLASAASGLWDFIWVGFKEALNKMIDLWNNLPGFTINVPDWFPGPDEYKFEIPNLPKVGGGDSGGGGGAQAPVRQLAHGGWLGAGPHMAAAGWRMVGQGFQTNGPQAIVGEGKRGWPEFVIPSDPAHRDNAWKLITDLLGRMGSGMAGGGTLGWNVPAIDLAMGAAQVGSQHTVVQAGTTNNGDHIGTMIGTDMRFEPGSIVVRDWEEAERQIEQRAKLRNLTRTRGVRSR